MVPRKVNQRKTMKYRLRTFIGFIILGIAIFGLVIAALYFLDSNKVVDTGQPDESVVHNKTQKEPEKKVDNRPAKIDFQPEVDAWVSSVSGHKSVIVYDLEHDELVGEYNSGESYGTASLYKLFVVYEGYRRVQSGAWNGDDTAGSSGHTIKQCLDLSVRESYSPCAESLWALIGHAELDEIIKNDFKITNSDISHLISNPKDILAILKIIYKHAEIKDEGLVAQMKDSFLNQPKTTYNWRQGLPSGFTKANVYNKVGWEYNPAGYWNIYHDAAIVEFPESNRHYIVVVMTNQVPFEKIRDFGSQIENKFYNS